MTSQNIRVVQVFRVEREIVLAVEAPDEQAAVEIQSESDAPAFDDPRWRSTWTLQNEEVEIAPDDRRA